MIGPEVVTDGLVLSLDVANVKSYPGSGNIWYDISGNDNHGTLVNGVGYSGDNMGSLTFDGVDNYVTLGTSLNITTTTYSICCWFYKTSTKINNGGILLSGGYGGDQDGIQIYTEDYSTTGDLRIAGSNSYTLSTLYYNNQNIPISSNIGTETYNLNEWIFVGVVGTVSSMDDGEHWIGANNNLTNEFSGNISNIQLYNRALTPSEILQNYNATKSRYGL